LNRAANAGSTAIAVKTGVGDDLLSWLHRLASKVLTKGLQGVQDAVGHFDETNLAGPTKVTKTLLRVPQAKTVQTEHLNGFVLGEQLRERIATAIAGITDDRRLRSVWG
jgi:hypothetical protein